MDNKKIKVILNEATVADYYELERIFNLENIKSEIVTQNTDGTEMGIGFNEFIVLLPLLTPFVIQFRKVLVAYFKYKKPLNKKTMITLEYNGKKLIIESENEAMPSVDEFMTFLGKDTKEISVDESCKQGVFE